jgi:hypothetical protein
MATARLTAREMLSHPWILNNYPSVAHTPAGTRALDAMFDLANSSEAQDAELQRELRVERESEERFTAGGCTS